MKLVQTLKNMKRKHYVYLGIVNTLFLLAIFSGYQTQRCMEETRSLLVELVYWGYRPKQSFEYVDEVQWCSFLMSDNKKIEVWDNAQWERQIDRHNRNNQFLDRLENWFN